MAGFVTGPTGEPAVFLAPTWSGDPVAGDTVLAPFLRLGTLVAGGVGPVPYGDLIRMFEQGAQPGQHYALGTRWLPTLTDDAIEVLAEARLELAVAVVAAGPAPLPRRRHPGRPGRDRVRAAPGAPARGGDRRVAARPATATVRAAAEQHAWVERVTAALAPGALPGGYPNILGPQDAERVRLGFGANADRLLAAKRRYDPDGVLTAIAAMGT